MGIKIAIERNMSALMRKKIDAICVEVKLLGEDAILIAIIINAKQQSNLLRIDSEVNSSNINVHLLILLTHIQYSQCAI
mgnify:CR=1 FL=1